MNVKRFLGLALFTYLMCAACAVVNQKDTTPNTVPVVPATITLGELTPQQLQDRAEELTATTTTSIRATANTATATSVFIRSAQCPLQVVGLRGLRHELTTVCLKCCYKKPYQPK